MVRFRNTKRLEEFISQNLSTGGMFLSTPVLKPEGEKVSVVVIHPISGKDFSIDAEVVRVNRLPTETEAKGMALQFLNLVDDKKNELESFLKG
jgi:c-di-GMP-binding flagellar brake protein YcgR